MLIYFPKYALIFQILQKFGNFGHFWGVFLNYFCLMWLEWVPLWVFQRIRTKIYTSTYIPEKLFSKFARKFQILQKLGHFFIIILHSAFSFAVSLANYTYMEYSQILADMMA